MTIFLRRIRNALIKSGNTGKYTVYAVGEIILVVIGILIAVQINNWTQTKKDIKAENRYFERLRLEIAADTASFNFEIKRLQNKMSIIEAFSGELNNPITNNSKLIEAAHEYLATGWMLPTVNTNKTTYNDLSSTGQFMIIADEEFRESIINLYLIYEGYESAVNSNSNWALSQDSEITLRTDALAFNERTAKLFGSVNDNKKAKIIVSNKEIFIRNAALHYWVCSSTIDAIKYLRRKSENVIEKIDEKLGRSI